MLLMAIIIFLCMRVILLFHYCLTRQLNICEVFGRENTESLPLISISKRVDNLEEWKQSDNPIPFCVGFLLGISFFGSTICYVILLSA